MRKGVTFIGSLVVDVIKMIDSYPPKGNLSNISDVSRSVGGLAANTSVSLKVLSPELTVAAVGLVGNDDSGKYLVGKLAGKGVDAGGIGVHPTLPTSFTDVMTEKTSGARTFFTAQGACAALSCESIDFELIRTSMAHVGYALLLDGLDAPDPVHGTGMAKVLKTLKKRGVKTSMDCVTETGERYKEVILPSLPYTDTLFMNEAEAGNTVGFPLVEGGEIDAGRVKAACAELLKLGVNELVVIHAPQGGWAMTKAGEFFFEPSLKLPEGYIKGAVGAGDAFCAGMLYAIANDLPVDEGLHIANLAAAANLSHSNSIDGMRPLGEIIKWAAAL